MANDPKILTAKGGFLTQTFKESGVKGCFRKIVAAVQMSVPLFLLHRRTNKSVGAYFDLITDDARLFYGDNFHFGFFYSGAKNLSEALDAHTDMVAQMAGLEPPSKIGQSILDIGCGICAPAVRIASRHDVRITGINISAEQVRQAKSFVETHGLSHRINVQVGNALAMPFGDGSFDSLLCLEVAGDICVTKEQKEQLAREMWRVLRPGGLAGFSDLVFTRAPKPDEEKIMRAILYHEGAELVTDWPTIFKKQGFVVRECADMIEHTHPTWQHSIAVYETRRSEVEARYGKRIAAATMEQMRRIPEILKNYGSFIVMSLEKPSSKSPLLG